MYVCGVAYDYGSNFDLILVGAGSPVPSPIGCATETRHIISHIFRWDRGIILGKAKNGTATYVTMHMVKW